MAGVGLKCKTEEALWKDLRAYGAKKAKALGIRPKPTSSASLTRTAAATTPRMPRRVVADSNVLISALHRRGTPQAIVDLARAGVQPKIIQKRAGHASIITTRRYLTATTTDERRALRAIDF